MLLIGACARCQVCVCVCQDACLCTRVTVQLHILADAFVRCSCVCAHALCCVYVRVPKLRTRVLLIDACVRC
jgi:hypothetical protein